MTLRIPTQTEASQLSKGELSALFRKASLALADPDPEVREAAERNIDWLRCQAFNLGGS